MTNSSTNLVSSNVVELPLKRTLASAPDRQAAAKIAPAHMDIQAALLRARIGGAQSALLVYRICGYRDLVETFGEEVGAQLLHSVQNRLRKCLRCEDTLRQLANDEFVVIPGQLASKSDLAALADRLLNNEGVEHALGELAPWVKAAVGITLQNEGLEPVAELIRSARIALRGAAQNGSSRRAFYSKDLMQRQQYARSLEAEMPLALEQGRFTLAFQPQYDLQSNEIVSLEALLRLQRHNGDLVPPTDFIGIAEDNGMILPLGRWVIRQACQQLAQWRAAGSSVQRVAVNLSPRQLEDDSLLDVIDEAIVDNGLDYSDLELELTESCVIEHTARNSCLFDLLRNRGVRLAIDDFGAGYSCFATLAGQDLDVLKLDRSFLTNISSEVRVQRVVTAIIAMAQQLGLDVIAEGVETTEQHQFLRENACTLVQGFGLARPADAATIESLLLEQDARALPGV